VFLNKLIPAVAAWLAAALLSWSALAADPIRIGLIEPFSGPIAAVGLDTKEGMDFVASMINERGGVLGGRHIEIVALDNAMNAEKTTQQLKKAVDMGLRFIAQGVGSNHALNIIKFLGKHNKRHPEAAILYLNYAAVTTAFTNELCSFWHFRFDANVDMKVAAIATLMNRDSSIRKVYMLNQNYAYGKSFQAAGRKFLAERAPNVELVGDELIVPFGKVLDFTPYIAKIKASGADTVLTGNWGPDLIRFTKAAASAGLDARFYTIYAGIPSTLAGIGQDGVKLGVKQLTESVENMDMRADAQAYATEYREKFGKSIYSDRIRWTIEMFAAALDKAGTDDPAAVARALEGMTFPGPAGEVVMRAADHQIQMPMVISTLSDKVDKTFIYAGKDFGVGWAVDAWTTREEAELPTTCNMNRPTS